MAIEAQDRVGRRDVLQGFAEIPQRDTKLKIVKGILGDEVNILLGGADIGIIRAKRELVERKIQSAAPVVFSEAARESRFTAAVSAATSTEILRLSRAESLAHRVETGP